LRVLSVSVRPPDHFPATKKKTRDPVNDPYLYGSLQDIVADIVEHPLHLAAGLPVEAVRKMRDDGKGPAEIAAALGVSRMSVWCALK
jgi:hypothetical protein